jgi:hypothetical protein
MDLFEFVVSFYAVLAGLGMTLLLRSIGHMLESRSRIQLYWVHSCWILFIFLMHVNSWFTLWAYRDLPSWTLGQLLLLVSAPILLYLASHLSVPEIPEHENLRHDMRSYFYARHRLLLGLLALAVTVTLIAEFLLLGQRVLSLNNGLRLLALALLLIGVASANTRVHAAITLVLLAMFSGSLAFLDAQIS